MADKRIHELDEASSVGSNDLLLIEQSSTNVDKKVKASNFMDRTLIESILADHPSWTTTVEDGSIDIDKLATDTLALINSKAETDGYYEDMAVGSAEQLLSNIFETDSTPYLYRTSGGSLEIGDRVYEDAIVGGSVAWNQLRNNYTASDVFNGVTLTNNITNIDLSGTADSAITIPITASINFLRDNRVYLILFNQPVRRFGIRGYGNIMGNAEGYGFMFKQSASSSWPNAIAYNTQENVGVSYSNLKVNVFDLYIMFGSTIADYAYTLEQSEAGAGIAWLKANGFFTKDYYPYNAGGIESVKTSAKKVVGFNQCDESFVAGDINTNTGANSTTTSARLRTNNYQQIIPSRRYYCKANSQVFAFFYDENKTYIGYHGNDIHGTVFAPINLSNTLRPSISFSRAKYVRFRYDIASYDNSFCLNFHWDGERDGEYEPYVEHVYPLDSDLELRGVPKLVDGKIQYDGDTYESDGSVTRKYGIVDLGTLDWTTTSATNVYALSNNLSDIKQAGSDGTPQLQIICAKYPSTSTIVLASGLPDKMCTINVNGKKLMIADSSYSTASALKTSLDGVYLVYELATPTTESADPYTNPQWVDNWGTEQYVDTRDVPVPVGHDSRYLLDLKAKLESAPNNPSTDGKYFLQYQNGEATYVPVPSEVPQTPSEDGTYVLKATVSGGTATLAWVAEE